MMTLTVFVLIIAVVWGILFLLRELGSVGGDRRGYRRLKNRESAPTTKDPVCGMQVEPSSLAHEYHGKDYYFCSEHCHQVFVESPGEFV